MSVFLIKTSQINACPKKSLSPGHYNPDGGCKCPEPAGKTLRAKQEQAVAEFDCPVCPALAGHPCLHQNSTRGSAKEIKRPHPERVQRVDPSLKGYTQRARRSSTEQKNATKIWEKNKRLKGWSDTEG
jgi:hypothetical protein